jgi:hypothetical protein
MLFNIRSSNASADGWNAGLLKLPDLAALAMDLSAHTLNFGPNVFYIRHGEAL